MASCTSRINIKLVVSSVIILASLVFWKKVITFSRKKKDLRISDSYSQSVREKNSIFKDFASLENMLLKENDSDSCSDSRGISRSNLEKNQSVESTMANGVNHQNYINGQRKDMRVTTKEKNQSLNLKNERLSHLNVELKNRTDIIPTSTSSNGDATSQDIINNNLNGVHFGIEDVKNGYSHNTHDKDNAEATHTNGASVSFPHGKIEENTATSSFNGVRRKIKNNVQASSNSVAHSNSPMKQTKSNEILHACSSNTVSESTLVRPEKPNGVIQTSSNDISHSSSLKQEKSEEIQAYSLNKVSQDASVRSKRLNDVVQASSNDVSHKFSSNILETSNELVQSSSNNFSLPNKSKSKKKRRGKLHESNNSCSVAPTMSDIDKTTTPHSDITKELSDELSALSVNDAEPSIEGIVKIDETSIDSNNSNSQNDFARTPSSTIPSSDDEFILSYLKKSDFLKRHGKAEKDKSIFYSENPCDENESGVSSEGLNGSTESLQVEVDDLQSSGELSATGGQSMLSPDNSSLNSNDSGRGASRLAGPGPDSKEFITEWPPHKCGILIGKKGSFVNKIYQETNASIIVRAFPFEDNKKIVSIMGKQQEIDAALKLIRRRFPLNANPDITLEPLVLPDIFCPPSLKITLPTEGTFQVVVSATITPGHFFIQLPTHPCFHALQTFSLEMSSIYNQTHTPGVTDLSPGNVVAAACMKDWWFRAEVVQVFPESETCQVRYLDFGGYQILPIVNLRQIHMDLMQMPFQAIECYLAGVTCHEDGWTDESKSVFEDIVKGQILSAYVAGTAEDGTPCLGLYHIDGATNTFINQALVEAGFLRYFPSDDN